MTKDEVFQSVSPGLYRVYWKDDATGGYSLAAVGMLDNGDRWLAPTNWLHPEENQNVWQLVDRMEVLPLRPTSRKT